MKKIFTAAIALVAFCTMSIAQTVTLPFTDGFEKSDGYPATFKRIGQKPWAGKDGYTGNIWKITFCGTENENKVYTTCIATEGAQNGSQCLKLSISARSFTPKANGGKPSMVRLRTNKEKFVAGQKNLQLTFWAKVEGDKALPVIKDKKKKVMIGTNWAEYTVELSATTKNGELLFDFLPLSDSDFSAANDYVIYMDNITISEK